MDNFEMRMNPTSISTTEDGKMYCEGLVNGTETWSKEMGIHRKFVERIKSGVFTRAIENAPRIDFLAEHDSTKLLASTENGSLELFEDSEGLKMRAEICPTSYGKDMYELMKAGMVRHMSFGFKSLKDKWERRSNGLYERTIEDMKLVEVSVVRNPAYAMSGISARNIELIEDVEIPSEVDEIKEEVELQETQENVTSEEVAKTEERALTVEQLQSAIDVLTEYMDSLKAEAPKEDTAEEVVEEEVKTVEDERSEEPVTEEKSEPEAKEVVEEETKEEENEAEVKEEEVAEEVEEIQEEKSEDSVIEEVEEKDATENKEETVEEVTEEQPSIDLTKYRQLIKEDIVL